MYNSKRKRKDIQVIKSAQAEKRKKGQKKKKGKQKKSVLAVALTYTPSPNVINGYGCVK